MGKKRTADAEKKKTLEELYFARALAILAVLMVHSTSQVTVDLDKSSAAYPVYNFLNVLAKFGTPTFIFLSAFVLFYSYFHRRMDKETVRRFYRKRLKFIIVPYLVFSVIYFVPIAVLYEAYDSLGDMLLSFFRDLLTGKAYAHLYFVFISIQFYILFPALLKFFQSRSGLIVHAVWIGLAVQWLFFFLNHFYSLYEWIAVPKGSLAVSYLSYYFTGALMGVHYKTFLRWMEKGWKYVLWLCWIVAGVAHAALYHIYRIEGVSLGTSWFELAWNVHAMGSALVVLHFSFYLYPKLSPRASRLWAHLGACSFGIYLFHPGLLLVYRKFMYSGSVWVYHVMVAGGFLLALGVSWMVVTVVCRSFKHAWVLFGLIPESFVPAYRVKRYQTKTHKI